MFLLTWWGVFTVQFDAAVDADDIVSFIDYMTVAQPVNQVWIVLCSESSTDSSMQHKKTFRQNDLHQLDKTIGSMKKWEEKANTKVVNV